jgi:riboflavin synthase alpha subunit
MYRGFISEVGRVVDVVGSEVVVAAPGACDRLEPGASVAVAGVCTSARHVADGTFSATISTETARRSTLDEIVPGAAVNIELPLRAGEALEGHLVQGHVDAVGKVVRVDEEPSGRRVWIRPPDRFLGGLVPKGSIAVDGVSLTIADIMRDRFSVALVPSTLERTTLAALAVGSRVNLESDVVDKLARRYESQTATALRRVVAALPWAGPVSGRTGVEKIVAQIAAVAAPSSSIPSVKGRPT